MFLFIFCICILVLCSAPTKTTASYVKTYLAINQIWLLINTYLHRYTIFAFKVTTWLISRLRGWMCLDVHLLLLGPPSGWMAGIPCESGKLKGRPPALIYLYTNKLQCVDRSRQDILLISFFQARVFSDSFQMLMDDTATAGGNEDGLGHTYYVFHVSPWSLCDCSILKN